MAGASHFGIILSGKDMASRPFGRVGTALNSVGKNATQTKAKIKAMIGVATVGAAAAAAGAIGLAASFKLAGKAGDFELALVRIGQISGATAQELSLLKEAATEAGIATQFSPREAATGLQNLAAQGFNAAESIALLKPSLGLAAGGMIGVDEATSTVASAMKVFGLGVEDAALATDKLLKITTLTALQSGDLQLALGTVGRGAVATGQDLTTMLVVMGLVKNTGVDTSVAASSASSALTFMAKNAKKFKAIGVSVTDASGKFRKFDEIALDTDKALSSVTNQAERAATVTKLFGRFGQTAFTAFTSQINKGVKDAQGNIVTGAAAMAELRRQMDEATGTTDEFVAAILNTFAGQKVLLQGSLGALEITLGEAFIGVLKPIVSGTIDLINFLIKKLQENAGFFRGLAAVVVVVSGVFLALGVAFLTVGAVILLSMIPAFLAMTKAAVIAAVTMFAAFWPYYLLAAAILGLLSLIFGSKVSSAIKNVTGAGPTPPGLGGNQEANAAGNPAEIGSLASFSGRSGRTALGEEEANRTAQDRRQRTRDREADRTINLNLETQVNMDGRELARGVEKRKIEEEKLGRQFVDRAGHAVDLFRKQ